MYLSKEVNILNYVQFRLRIKSEAYSEPSKTSEMELFAKIVNGIRPLDVWQSSEYTSPNRLVTTGVDLGKFRHRCTDVRGIEFGHPKKCLPASDMLFCI